jgi:formylglycine-generating enzyme required for sulfatase activity
MEFVWIPSMNCWVGRYEVTNAEYRKSWLNHDSGQFEGCSLNGDRQPVVRVKYDEAKRYAYWLTQRELQAGRLEEGRKYRLPDDDEWMTLAQCGDGRRFPWGNRREPPKDWNYRGQESPLWSGFEGHSDPFVGTCPVEKSGKNTWGLYGVGGNVWEWTQDCLRPSVGNARGGSYYEGKDEWGLTTCQFIHRDAQRLETIGFRLLLATEKR